MPRAAAALALLAATAAQAQVQWETDTEPVPGTDRTLVIATVRNATDERFGVFRGEDGRLRAFFAIGPGFDRLAGDGCPTYVVDAEPPSIIAEDGTCAVGATEARGVLAPLVDGKVRSDLLSRLIMGGRLTVRYRLAARGYRESSFTLRGSGQALFSAIGRDVEVLPR